MHLKYIFATGPHLVHLHKIPSNLVFYVVIGEAFYRQFIGNLSAMIPQNK